MAMVGSITRGEIMGTPGTDLFGKDKSEESYQPEETTDLSTLIGEGAFLGDCPFDSIMGGITDQFNDYINMEDSTNYVDIFYDQLHASYEDAQSNETNMDLSTITEILDSIQIQFVEKMSVLFKERLTISFSDLEGETVDWDDLEFMLRRLYEFFILGAKNNFKTVIAFDVRSKVDQVADEREYFKKLQELMNIYSPLITNMGPIEFLKYRNDVEIIEMFDNGKVVGNFLRKYTPKFYQNEEFLVEVINHVTMIKQFKKDIVDSVEGIIESGDYPISDLTRNLINNTTESYLKLIQETVCEESDDDDPAVYEYGENYETEYEKGPYKD